MTQTIETHYDCLKVVRNAPVEVIKASYRVLSQKYHPDRNPAPDAVDRMTRINQAWDVLSDPERRATHDRWIATQERKADFHAEPERPRSTPRPARAHARASSNGIIAVWTRRYGIEVAAVLAVATAIALLLSYFVKPAEIDFEEPAVAQSTPDDFDKTVWHAKPWEAVPAKRLPHGYIDSEIQYYSDGLSTFDIDNTGGARDADVRLYRNGRAVRSMFVHRGKHFVAEKLPAGTYTMKYQVAVDGKMRAYQANADFQLSQTIGEGGEGKGDTFTQAHVSMSGIDGGTHEIPLDQI